MPLQKNYFIKVDSPNIVSVPMGTQSKKGCERVAYYIWASDKIYNTIY